MAIKDIYEAILSYDKNRVAELTQKELAAGTDAPAILHEGLISALNNVGERYSTGELFVPEMLLAARAMKSGLELLKPQLIAGAATSKGKVVIGTVKGDLHDIGKNLVAIMLEGAGYEVIDLGVDVSAETFVAAVRETKADVVALSALLTTTMTAMEQTITTIRKAGSPVKTIIGGAPVTKPFADRIGADGFAPDAPGATKLVASLLA